MVKKNKTKRSIPSRKTVIYNYLKLVVKEIIIGDKLKVLNDRECRKYSKDISALGIQDGIQELLQLTKKPLQNGYLSILFTCDLKIINSATNALRAKQLISATNKGWVANDLGLVKVLNVYRAIKGRLGGDSKLEASLLKEHFASQSLESLSLEELKAFDALLVEIYQKAIAKQQRRVRKQLILDVEVHKP